MSNIFSEIDEEVKVDKYKKIWSDHKISIISIISVIVIIFTVIVSYSIYQEKRHSRIGGKYLEALSLVISDKNKAEEIFLSIVDEGISGYSNLASLSLAGLKLQENKLDEAKEYLQKNRKHISDEKEPLYRISNYMNAIHNINVNLTEEAKKRANEIFNYGGYWSMLAIEIKGYAYLKEKDYESASKAFKKVLNEELSTQGSKLRANEMIKAINLIKDK